MGHLALQRYFVKRVGKLNRKHVYPKREDLLLELSHLSKWWQWPRLNYILVRKDVYYRFREALDDTIGVYLGYDDVRREKLSVTKEGRKLISKSGFVEELLRAFSSTTTFFIGMGGATVLLAIGSYLWKIIAK